MKNKRGEVVLLDYPYSDGSGSKVRPALVVQADLYNAKLTNTVVALITKNIARALMEPSQFLIDITTVEGQQSGLKVTSAVTCSNLFTIHEKHILKTIGTLPTVLMQRIDACLKAALELV